MSEFVAFNKGTEMFMMVLTYAEYEFSCIPGINISTFTPNMFDTFACRANIVDCSMGIANSMNFSLNGLESAAGLYLIFTITMVF